ncbi:MAG: LCP family protein [Coriobacteriales bacterium]|jgi:LCP family protein required for cell wall assembly|nr:LCP family protein [Coriobacteriales bacterium]
MTQDVHSASYIPGAHGKHKKIGKRAKIAFISIAAVIVAAIAAAFIAIMLYSSHINTLLAQNPLDHDVDYDALDAALVPHTNASDPFYMLIAGTDGNADKYLPFADAIMLVRVDPAAKTVALISVPRDTDVLYDGRASLQKIDMAVVFAEQQQTGSGPAALVSQISKLTGVGISYYAQFSFDGFEDVVDALGGVSVDVPTDMTDPHLVYAFGDMELKPGEQTLNGAQSLFFVRSRYFPNGDFQRGADLRIFTTALIKQIKSEDPATLLHAIDVGCQMTVTNMRASDLASVALALWGTHAQDVHSYQLPVVADDKNPTAATYVLPDEEAISNLFAQLDSGNFPAS